MAYKFFDKKAEDTSTQTGTGISENQELTPEKNFHRLFWGCLLLPNEEKW